MAERLSQNTRAGNEVGLKSKISSKGKSLLGSTAWSLAGILSVLAAYKLLPQLVSIDAAGSFPGGAKLWSELTSHPGYYLSNTSATILAAGVGLLFGGFGGLVAGLLAGTSSRAYFFLTPLAVWLKATPIIALSPFFALLLTGHALSLAAASAAAVCFFPVFVNVAFGLRKKSSPELEYFLSLRPDRLQTLVHIEIPTSLGFAIAGLKTASTLAVVGATVGEFIGARKGIGFVVIESQHHSNFSRLMLGILLAGMVGVGFYGLTAASGSLVANRFFPGIAEELRRR